MSLFVAVRPDAGAVEDLQHVVETVRRMPVADQLRWQPPSQWHVTLAFLGDPDDDVADSVAERLGDLDRWPRVTGLSLAGAGCFGRQVLWMGLAEGDALEGLRALQDAVPPRLRGSGATVDRRPWRPHLTVARARHGDARSAAVVLGSYRGPRWDVDEVLLVRSSGGPHPAHRVAASVRLDGRAPS